MPCIHRSVFYCFGLAPVSHPRRRLRTPPTFRHHSKQTLGDESCSAKSNTVSHHAAARQRERERERDHQKDRDKQKAPTEPTKAFVPAPAPDDQAGGEIGSGRPSGTRRPRALSSSPASSSPRPTREMGLLELFVTACMPVLNMLLVTGVGSFLATDSAGILGKEARKHLNYVVFYVFNPSLISTYLAKTITMESLAKLWFMPVNVLFTFTFGLIFGWIVIKVTRAPLKLRGLILGCCSAGNLGNIFLIIIPALCKEKGSPFGAPDVCQTYGLAYSSLSLAIGAVFLWTGAYNIIRANSNVTEEDGNSPITQTKVLVSGSTISAVSEDKHSISSDRVDECALLLISNRTKTKVPLLERAKGFVSSVSGAVDLKKLFAPSTIGVIVGFIIGGTPLIRNALIGDDAPLRVLRDSAELIGGAAVPSVTLIMGGNLITGLRGRASVPPSVIAGVVVVRYVLLPLVGTVLVKAAVRYGVIRPDPLYQFVLLLQHAVPPAMNIGTITQLFGVGESECSVIFVWVYALASVAVTVWSAFFMWTLS